ncbi:hypothetical protein ABDK75_03475 [Gluconobacter sp. OJA]|uniref:hypothetical protein n=1 Tax=Gluconobacter sp. OJA TaxID=3145197 RepID=UPI0031F7A9C7
MPWKRVRVVEIRRTETGYTDETVEREKSTGRFGVWLPTKDVPIGIESNETPCKREVDSLEEVADLLRKGWRVSVLTGKNRRSIISPESLEIVETFRLK